MLPGQVEGVIPNPASVYALLLDLEHHYQVSLKFWVEVYKPQNGSVLIHVYCSGSGDVFDLLDPDHGVVHSPVLHAQGGSIYPAMWSCLCQLRSAFGRTMKRHA